MLLDLQQGIYLLGENHNTWILLQQGQPSGIYILEKNVEGCKRAIESWCLGKVKFSYKISLDESKLFFEG